MTCSVPRLADEVFLSRDGVSAAREIFFFFLYIVFVLVCSSWSVCFGLICMLDFASVPRWIVFFWVLKHVILLALLLFISHFLTSKFTHLRISKSLRVAEVRTSRSRAAPRQSSASCCPDRPRLGPRLCAAVPGSVLLGLRPLRGGGGVPSSGLAG